MGLVKNKALVKKVVIGAIVRDTQVMRALSNDKSDFLDSSYPDNSIEENMELLDTRIFDRRAPETLENEAKSIVSIGASVHKSEFPRARGLIQINTLVHESLMKTDYSLKRNDYLLHKLETMLEGALPNQIITRMEAEDTKEYDRSGEFVRDSITFSFDIINLSKACERMGVKLDDT